MPNAHEVETYNGFFVDTKNPNPNDIHIEDIAHALSNTCRYGGHCNTFYSVAEHAVFCAERAKRRGYPIDLQIACLHHDDSEAYLGDIPTPTKSLLGKGYEKLTDRMDEAIIESLGLVGRQRWFHSPEVDEVDKWALMVEARHLLPSGGRSWDQIPGQPARIVTPDYWLGGIEPELAKFDFLKKYEELHEGGN